MKTARMNLFSFLFMVMILVNLGSGGLCRAQPLTPQAPTSDARWVTLILDKSGSMKPVAGQMRRSIDLFVDVLAHYNRLFPDKRVNLLTVYFDSRAKVVFAGPVESLDQFRRSPGAQYTYGGETSIREAVTCAVNKLVELNVTADRNMTVLMTDAEELDVPDRPKDIVSTLGATNIERLGSTWCIYLPHPGASKKVPSTLLSWQNMAPIRERSSSTRIEAASDLLPTFLLSLWKYYFAQLDTKLVRYYQETPRDGTITLSKHSPKDAVEAILSRPGSSTITAVISPSGGSLTAGDYEIIERSSFFVVKVKESVPRGEYKIRLSEKSGEKLSLITFEDIPVTARAELSPERPGGSYPKDSQVQIRFRFWDARNDLPVEYPEFLKLVFFKYEINPAGPRAEKAEGSDPRGLTLSDSYKQDGVYTISFAWHYHPALLMGKAYSDIGKFTIEGDLNYALSLDLDNALAWEGRNLPMKVGLLPKGGGTPVQFTRLVLQATVRESGRSMELAFDAPEYQTELPLQEQGRYDFQYLKAEPPQYSRQISMDRSYTLDVQGRKIQYERQVMKDALIEEQPGTGVFAWWSRIFSSIKAVRGKLDPVSLPVETAAEAAYPLLVKFSGEQESRLECKVSLNKLFPDENGFIEIEAADEKRISRYDLKGTSESFLSLVFDAVAGLFGGSSSAKTIPDAVTLEYELPKGETAVLPGDRPVNLIIKLTKKAAWVSDEVFPVAAPPITLKGRINTPLAQVRLKPVVLNVQLQRTSSVGAYAWSAIVTALMLLGLLAALLIAIAIVSYKVRIRTKKMEIWQRKLLSYSPEDFFETLPLDYRSLWRSEKMVFAEDVRRIGHQLKGGGRAEMKHLWKRFAKPLPLKETKELGEKCRRPNIPSSWDFEPGEIQITAYAQGTRAVRHRDEGVGEVGTIHAAIVGEAIQEVRFAPFEQTVICDGRPCIPGRPWPLKNGSECLIGPDTSNPAFAVKVTWDQEVHIHLYR